MGLRSLHKGRITSAASHWEQKESNADCTSEPHGFTLEWRLPNESKLAAPGQTSRNDAPRCVWPQEAAAPR
jgi:hypothetical protein